MNSNLYEKIIEFALRVMAFLQNWERNNFSMHYTSQVVRNRKAALACTLVALMHFS